jgi:hypothetical protein
MLCFQKRLLLAICDCNIHRFQELGNRKFQKGRIKKGVFISPAKLYSCQAKLNQKAFEPPFIPTRASLLPFNNKGGVFPNPMTKGFIDSQGRLDVNEFDEETMFIEPGQILDPVREFRILLFQV